MENLQEHSVLVHTEERGGMLLMLFRIDEEKNGNVVGYRVCIGRFDDKGKWTTGGERDFPPTSSIGSIFNSLFSPQY